MGVYLMERPVDCPVYGGGDGWGGGMFSHPLQYFVCHFMDHALVISHRMPHRLFIYDYGNAQIGQSDLLIYFSRHPD